jgi:hypothetical protein
LPMTWSEAPTLRLHLFIAGRTRIFGRKLRWSRIGRQLRVWRWLYVWWLRVEDRLRKEVGAGRLGAGDRNARARQASVGIIHTQAMPAPTLRETTRDVAERADRLLPPRG